MTDNSVLLFCSGPNGQGQSRLSKPSLVRCLAFHLGRWAPSPGSASAAWPALHWGSRLSHSPVATSRRPPSFSVPLKESPSYVRVGKTIGPHRDGNSHWLCFNNRTLTPAFGSGHCMNRGVLHGEIICANHQRKANVLTLTKSIKR